MELEAEYKHILYPGKKKKTTKLGFPKKKKKPVPEEPAAAAKKTIKTLRRLKAVGGRLRGVAKKAPIAAVPAAAAPESRTRSSAPLPATAVTSVAWKGKKASGKAYDRTDRSKRPFTSSKIEDVTGRYGKVTGMCEHY